MQVMVGMDIGGTLTDLLLGKEPPPTGQGSLLRRDKVLV
jgi:hypothetical protein